MENVSGSFETANLSLPPSLTSFEFRPDQLVEQSFDASAIHLKFDVKTGSTATAPSMTITIDSRHAPNDKIAYVGEVSELDPGKTGTLTKPLKAGTYILMCNVAGHFAAGMWTLLTVN